MHVAQVVHGHARDNDLDVLTTETADRSAQGLVLLSRVAIEKRDLDNGDGEGIRFGVECFSQISLRVLILRS